MIARFVRDPLCHFLVLGAVLFSVQQWRSGESDDSVIQVGEPQLVNFLQYRGREFNEDTALQSLRDLSEDERQALIERYIEEEALYREASRMGLDQYDYVARLRLVQQLEFLLASDMQSESMEVDEQVLQQFWRDHQGDYIQPAKISFSQVFIRQAADAPQRAEAVLKKLQQQNLEPQLAAQLGDRPPYFTHYVDRTQSQTSSFLGRQFAQTLFADAPLPENQWLGPFQSSYGFHLLKITDQAPEQTLDFSSVRERVFQDYRQQRYDEVMAERRQAIVDQFQIQMGDRQGG